MTGVSPSHTQLDAGLQNSPAFGAICTSLETVLNEGVDVHRCLAAKALGQINATKSVKSLIKALLDEDEDVRSDAAEALLKLADPKSGHQLMENLVGDPCTEVKLMAIATLAKLGDQSVIPWLRRMVKGRDSEIAWDEEEFFSSGWDDWVEVQVGAIRALAELNAVEAIPDIVAAIYHDDAQDMTITAFLSLAKMGQEGFDALAGFLDSDDTRLRRRAAAILANADREEAREALIRAIADPSAEVRSAMLKARAKHFSDDKLLVGLLQDIDTEIRADAAILIGYHYPDQLRVLLDDPSEKVRIHALIAVANIDANQVDDELVKRLCDEISNPSQDISVAASTSLAAIAPFAALEVLPDLLENISQSVTVRLGALKGLIAIGGDQTVAPLVSVVDDDQRQIRLEAMSALAKLAASDDSWPNIAGSTLLAALSGEYDPEDIPEKEEEKTDQQDEQEVERNEDTLESAESEPVEVNTEDDFPVSTLDSILSEAPGMAPTVGLPGKGIELTKTDMERLAIAKRAIGKKKVKLEPKIAQHDDIRQFAARILGDLDRGNVIEALAAALNNGDNATCLAAADSLARINARIGQLPENVVEIICENLSTDDQSLKLNLIRSLAGCDDSQAMAQLETLLGDVDSSVRLEAIRACSGNSRLEARIEGLLTDPEPTVRINAAETLARIAGSKYLEKLIEFSFSFEGYHGRQVANLLRKIDKEQASAAFLRVLDDPARKRVWSVAIEALEELNIHKFSRNDLTI